MRKNYKLIGTFMVVMCLAVMKLGAQPLNGLYTINSGMATGGSNFQTFNDFAVTINSVGIAGPVVVDVVVGSGPYVEQIQFTQITGASAANRVTINGNANLITFNSTNSAAPWTIAMNGTDYFTIQDLQVEGTGPTYAYALKMWNNADYNVISSCSFSVPANNTSTFGIPISISGNGTSYSSSGPGANHTLIEKCTTFSGYAGISIYGNGSVNTANNNSFLRGNRIVNCTILDFYYAGIWHSYFNHGTVIEGNDISCPTRNNATTRHGIYSIYNDACITEGNIVHDLFANLLSYTGTGYGLFVCYGHDSYYYGYSYPSRYPSYVRNNIVYNMNFNGTAYGIRSDYIDGEVYNNTVSMDYANSTAGTTYGIYSAGNINYKSDVSNNIISVTRGGSGTKYGWYAVGGSNALNTGDRNDIYMNAPAGTNFVGFYTAAAPTHSAFIAQGVNVNGFSVNPVFVNMAAQDFHPTDPTINNMASQKGLVFDAMGAIRNQSTPDLGALEFLTPNCNGAPNNNVIGASYSLCPGEQANLGIGILNSDAGFTYQWQVSNISQVGPFTSINGANGIAYVTPPVNQNLWYSVVITCTNPGGGVATPVATIQVASTTTNTVHYLETFENIGKPNRLPNCSWYAPNMGSSAKTFTNAQSANRLPRSGSSFATFEAGTGGTNYYYSNGVWMDPGITYSASLWYQTDFTGATNWTDLSIMLGTAQTPTGLVGIASTNGPAVSPIYKPLSNTFTVAASGLYYVAVRGTAASGAAQFLTWDDLEISIPCTSVHNPVNLTLNANTTSVCSGAAINMSASGADTYTWNTGAMTAAVSVTPNTNTLYSVSGTNLLTGCNGTSSQLVTVKQSPYVTVYAFPPVSCAGKPVNLVGGGATTYTWSSGGNGASSIVSPGATTSYTLLGSANGCTSKASVMITVNNLPNVSAFSSSPLACKGEPVTVSGTGALTYQWTSTETSNVFQGAIVTTNVNQVGQATFTVVGTDANGCQGSAVTNVIVDACTGLNKFTAQSGNVKVYPNPTTGAFTLEVASKSMVEIADISGRIVFASISLDNTSTVDISTLAAGVYYVKVNSDTTSEVIKLIKQ